MKARSWFNRLLSTYLPIFYLVVFFLLFIFFMTISQMMNRDMSRTSENYAKYVLQTLESSLKNIEQVIYGELNNNEDLQIFLYQRLEESDNNEYILNRRLSSKFNSMLINYPLIDSIYFYRTDDQKVLSTSAVLSLESFGDRSFIKQLLGEGIPQTWTGVRSYQLFDSQTQVHSVVSLVRQIPLLSSPRGLLIVNVSTYEINKMVEEMKTQNISHTSILDQVGSTIAASAGSGNDLLSSLRSEYLGWEIRHAINDNYNYGLLKGFYMGWIILGGLAILIATVIMIYFARKYTSPIDNTMMIMKRFSKSKSKVLPDILSDNPRFIDKAVDHLIEIASQYSDVHQENSLHRRKQLFVELVGGERMIDLPIAEQEMRTIGMLRDFSNLNIGILEIDKYVNFCEVYSPRDQYLIKYVILGAIKEIAEMSQVYLWSEWLENGRLTILFQTGLEYADANAIIYDICDRTRMWIDDNLDYSVSIGIGCAVTDLVHVSHSFDEAEEALTYKASVGGNRVIPSWELEENLHKETFEQLQVIRDIADSFKQRNRDWESCFHQLVATFQNKLYLRQDVVNLLNYMIFHISREMSGLPSSYTKLWDKTMVGLSDALKEFESLEELRETFIVCLRDAIEQMEKLRAGRNNQELALQAKAYIEHNYDQSELSLALLGDHFNINQSYLSRLFKDEIGENFVDFLARIRIRQAKHLLLSTDRSIQDIAIEVGYVHYFSFNRVFKKNVGVTPGEYRKKTDEPRAQ
jgi:two-component system response regulator YesN